MLLLCSQTYFKISILPDASWAALSMSVPKSTYNYFRECFRKLKMDGNKMPREPRALKSCFATLLICRAGTVLSWAGHGHTGAVQAGEVCGCHAPATPFTLAPKLRHSQLGGDARPSTNSEHAEAQVMAARELWSRGKLSHVICNNKVTFIPRL